MLEHVSLLVRPGGQRHFESAFKKAERLLSGLRGYLAHELRRSVDREQHYLLLIEWRAIEDRTLGFTRSHEHVRWRDLLQGFLLERPQVEFFAAVAAAPIAGPFAVGAAVLAAAYFRDQSPLNRPSNAQRKMR